MPYLRRGFLKSINRPNHLFARLSIAPFPGVAIVLLLVLMSPFGFVGRTGVSVELAKCAHARKLLLANREDAIHVAVSRDGSIYFGNNRLDLGYNDDREVLSNGIHESLLKGAENRVYLSADGRAKYRDVEPVIEQVGLAGVQNLSFITN